MKTMLNDDNRFQTDASRYAAYLETPEGRLRADLTLANVREFLPPADRVGSLRALDIGGGTGVAAVRLASLGIHVSLLDSSEEMLEIAKHRIGEAKVLDKVVLQHGEAAHLLSLFKPSSFDIILCHNVLEFVDDPACILRGAVRLMRDSSVILSVLVRHQAGEVLKAALLLGDLAAAEQNLTSEWGQESLYAGRVRLFTPQTLESMMRDASLAVTARRGVRVLADYLPPQISRSGEYDRIFALERKLGARQEFFGVARYLQYVARRRTLTARERE